MIPITISEDRNLTTGMILPVIHQPGLASDRSSDNGIGDLQFTGFLSPSDSAGFTLGVGPVL